METVLDPEYFILILIFCLARLELKPNRVNVLIGIHQPVGTAQTRHLSVRIGSQLIGTAQIKRVGLRAITLFMAMRSSS